jgi:hypothetical protein
MSRHPYRSPSRGFEALRVISTGMFAQTVMRGLSKSLARLQKRRVSGMRGNPSSPRNFGQLSRVPLSKPI